VVGEGARRLRKRTNVEAEGAEAEGAMRMRKQTNRKQRME